MKNLIYKILPILDLLAMPLVYPAAWLLKSIRSAGVHRLPFCKRALLQVGVFPIRNHYYEPQFDNQTPKSEFDKVRILGGIDWNVSGQLELLEKFNYATEIEDITLNDSSTRKYSFNNDTFESGDAEYWYQLIRTVKPQRIIEVGSGNSTLMAIEAITKNSAEDANYQCDHICIEPYEMDWLEAMEVTVVRKKIEDIELSFFSVLEENDILFIDSSHIIRPEGDVLFEYLEMLPSLQTGVIVHLHDIFSPRQYLRHWVQDEVRFWNEQYLLEAFLTHNKDWKVIGAVNYLKHNHYDKLKSIAPKLTPQREPGSFYIQRIHG